MPQTGPQVHPQRASQTAVQVNSAEALPPDLQVTVRVAGTIDVEIADEITVGLAVGFAAETASGIG